MEDFKKILAQYWGYNEFRKLQLEIIESLASGKDTLGLMPTGGGKSITFQVYSLSRKGICIVITPLISLMKDQIANLNRRGIKALVVHSGMSSGEIKVTLDNAVWGAYKFLYISPERLNSERFMERLVQMDVNLITVDEAHCISQWGYDFRPSYLNIAVLRKLLPDVTFLALTATATPKVADDIQDKLGFKQRNVFSMSFSRPNLNYLVRHIENKVGYIVETLGKTTGSGIVYVRNRKATHDIADELQNRGIAADYYHAGLNASVRNSKQDLWMTDKTRVIVATNAFGMGIDKPDVRFVIHCDVPDSLEAYYQEAGRAGRDGKKSAAVLLCGNNDSFKLKKRVSTAYPEKATIRKIYNSICNYLNVAQGFGREQKFIFQIHDFALAFKYQPITVHSSLRILQREGYLEYVDEADNPSRVHFTISRNDLYKLRIDNAVPDDFINTLLRTYTGLFTEYVVIDEDLLARYAGIDRETVCRFLKNLRKAKVIDYIPRNKTPYILLTNDRVPADRLKITPQNYDLRRADFKERVDAMIRYIESSECRAAILLDYLGEAGAPRCGQCDTCRAREDIYPGTPAFKKIAGMLKDILKEPCTGETIFGKIDADRDQVKKVLEYLVDEGTIIFRKDNKVEWTLTT